MRRILLSFLGLGDYEPCYYTYKGEKSTYTRFIQTALYEHMRVEGPLDIIVFTTKEAKAQNWKNRQKDEKLLEGLESALTRITPDANVQLVEISSSQDEDANWRLFDTILSQIHEEDEIYFDMTHSFRSIPFVSLIVLNYARLVKKAKIKKLMYGLYQKNHPEELSQIIDVTNMLTLLDWTNGVNQFIRTGDASLVNELTNEEAGNVFRDQSISKDEKKSITPLKQLAKQLNTVSQSFQTCRSLKITEEIQLLRHQIAVAGDVQTERIKPLIPLLTEIKSKYGKFGHDEIMNGFLAAQWCEEHQLLQPGFTLLQENCVTAICRAFGLDVTDREKRVCINSTIKILLQRIPKERWKVNKKDIPFIEKMLNELQPYRELLKPFDVITEYRNDINHAGTNSSAIKPEKFQLGLKTNIEKFRPFFEKMSELAKLQV